jgi:hypothetical protein
LEAKPKINLSFNIYDQVDHVSTPIAQVKLGKRVATLKHPNTNKLKRVFNFICGIETTNNTEASNAGNKIDQSDMVVTQSQFSSNICNLNAILLMTVTGFIYAFFNNYA